MCAICMDLYDRCEHCYIVTISYTLFVCTLSTLRRAVSYTCSTRNTLLETPEVLHEHVHQAVADGEDDGDVPHQVVLQV